MTAGHGDNVKVVYQCLSHGASGHHAGLSKDTVEFTIGRHQVITGFEEAVIGMCEGDEKTVTIPMEKAYGRKSEKNLVTLSREKLPNISLEVGKYLCVRTANGRRAVLAVSDVSESDVMLNTNHPLAGRDLTFRIKLSRIHRPRGRGDCSTEGSMV